MPTDDALPLKDFLVLFVVADKGPLDLARLLRGFRKLTRPRVRPRRIRRALMSLEARGFVRPESSLKGETDYHATTSGLAYVRDHAMAFEIASFEPE